MRGAVPKLPIPRFSIAGSLAFRLLATVLGAGLIVSPPHAQAAAPVTDDARRDDAEHQAGLARDVESFGRTTGSVDALILAARLWSELGASRDRDRALALATSRAAGDPDLVRAIAAARNAHPKGIVVAPPLDLAPGASATVRRRIGGGGALARVTASQPMRIRLTVTDRDGTELCSATGATGGAECRWTARWDGDVTLSIVNLGEDQLSAWTITRSADNDPAGDEGVAKWR